jgi:hypothetical protein
MVGIPPLCRDILFGQDRKLGELVYEDLVYSFMSIIGATMVLVVGLENMWNIVVSLFEEILLLSEDTRACHKY